VNAAVIAGLAIAGLSLTACGSTQTITRNVPGPVVTRTVTRTKIVIKAVKVKTTVTAPAPAPAPAPAASAAPAAFRCTVMGGADDATGLEARIWGPLSYQGPVSISFSDGSADVFPGLTASMPSGGVAWVPIPTADVGASAEPSQCFASD
jgi:hypothetical protein